MLIGVGPVGVRDWWREMASDDISFSSENWRWTGEPLNGPLGLHGTVALVFPTFVLAGMFLQMTGRNPFYLFFLFWGVYIVLSIYARMTGYSPREAIRRIMIRQVFRGRYKV